jgi:hypothetical protein
MLFMRDGWSWSKRSERGEQECGQTKQDWRGVLGLLREKMSCDNFVRAGKLGRSGAAPLQRRDEICDCFYGFSWVIAVGGVAAAGED